jgi:hypothetical protein
METVGLLEVDYEQLILVPPPLVGRNDDRTGLAGLV